VRAAFVVFASLATVTTACGGADESVRSADASTPARDLGPLALLLPSGAELVVTARPSELMEAPPSRRVIDSVFPQGERDAFAQRTGIEPGELDELVVGDYGEGFVIVARGPWAARDLVIATASRMTSVEVSAEAPFVRRAGFLGSERRDISAIGEDVVLFTAAVPDVTASILARVRSGRFSEGAAPALSGADVGPLFARHETAPLALYVPAPLVLPPGLGTSVLLARERALVAVAEPQGALHLAFGVQLVGEFPSTAEENFRTLITSIAETDLGGALGMQAGLETLEIQVAENTVVLGLSVPSETLSTGLRVLFGAEIEELLAAPVRSP